MPWNTPIVSEWVCPGCIRILDAGWNTRMCFTILTMCRPKWWICVRKCSVINNKCVRQCTFIYHKVMTDVRNITGCIFGCVYVYIAVYSWSTFSFTVTSWWTRWCLKSLTIIYLTVYSVLYQRKLQSTVSLAFGGGGGIHQWPVNSPHKGPVTRKMFPFHDVIMSLWESVLFYVLMRANIL